MQQSGSCREVVFYIVPVILYKMLLAECQYKIMIHYMHPPEQYNDDVFLCFIYLYYEPIKIN